MVLFWTTWFRTELQIEFDACPISNCRLTHDRQMLNESDAVVFHLHPHDPLDQLPGFRTPDQRYILLTFESPIHSDRKKYRTFPRNFFNWTATYRSDSDLFRESIYGYQFQPKQNFMEQPGLGNYYAITASTLPARRE